MTLWTTKRFHNESFMCSLLRMQIDRKREKKKTRKKKAGSRPPTPYTGPIYHSYFDLTLDGQLNISDIPIGIALERLVIRPATLTGNFSP